MYAPNIRAWKGVGLRQHQRTRHHIEMLREIEMPRMPR